MRILLVDYDLNRLKKLSDYMVELYPDDIIISEKDSLMAGKKCFFNPYDIVLSNLTDRRLDGRKMKEFARHANPEAKYIICGDTSDLYEWGITDEFGNICEDGIDGVVAYPVTKEKLMKTLGLKNNITMKSSIPKNANSEISDDELEYVAGGYSDDTHESGDAIEKLMGEHNNPH